MTYGFYFLICPFLLIIQTAIIPQFSILYYFYDILIPFFIFLGLNRPVRENIAVILVLGLMMDCLSGTPFMLYVTAYFWMYVIVQILAKIIQAGVHFRLPLLVSVGVLIQNLIFLFVIVISGSDSQLPGTAFKIITLQLIWAFITGAVVMLFFKYAYLLWQRVTSGLVLKKKRYLEQ